MSLEANTTGIIIGLGLSTIFIVALFVYLIRRQGGANTGERDKTKQIREMETELIKVQKEKEKIMAEKKKLSEALSLEIRKVWGETDFLKSALEKRHNEKLGITLHQIVKKPAEEKSVYELSAEQPSETPDTIEEVVVIMPETTQNISTTASSQELPKKPSPGRTFYQKSDIVIREFDRMDFHFSSLALIWGYFGEQGNTVMNPVLTDRPKLFAKQELFMRIQTYLNNLAKDGLYVVPDEDLKELKKNIWTGDMKKIITAIDKTNEKNGFLDEGGWGDISWRSIFKYLLIRTLDSIGYRAYTLKDDEEKDSRNEAAMGVMKKNALKRAGSQIELTPDELKIEEQLKMNVEVINEIASVIRSKPVVQIYGLKNTQDNKKEQLRRSMAIKSATSYIKSIWWEFLDIDVSKRILKLKVPVEYVFSKKMGLLMDHYRNEKDLALIEFYLY